MTAKAKNSWYEITAKTDKAPTCITIDDEIGGWGVSAKQFRSDFARLGKNEAIRLHICSGGGSVFAGNEIANIIREHEGEVNITLGSICASIATVVMCAGAKVTAAKNTLIMVHNPSVYAGGDSDEMRKMADIMDKMKGGIVDAYIDKTGKSAKELSDAMDEETWLDAEEAKAFGFVDEIVEEDADDDVIDNVDLEHYKNTATLLSRLQITDACELAKAQTGNGKRLTLQAIRNAAETPPPQKKKQDQSQQNQKPVNKTPEEIQADKLEIMRLAKEEAKNLVAASNARIKEIRDAVSAVLKRDKKDFTALADEFINDETKTVDQFFRAMSVSDKFKNTEVVGSGIELFEPLDAHKGTPGFRFVNSPEFRAMAEAIKRGGRRPQGGVNLQVQTDDFRNTQTSTATSGSGLTSIEKYPGVVMLGVRPLVIEDLIDAGQTNDTTFRYIQEVTYTQAAASVAETGALPQLTMTYTETDAPVKDIGGYVKMSENLLADYAGVASFINGRVPYQVDRAVDDQLLTGDGTGTNITGILNTAGIQTLAKGVNTNIDLTLKLQTLVRWQAMTAGQAQGGFEPDAYVVHPLDWELLVLTKDANGQYLCRGPFTGSYGNPAQQGSVGSIVEFYTLWGKKVAISPAIAQGTILCGSFRMGAMKLDRQGLILEMTNSDASDFLSRIVTLRGTRRLALAVWRPGSFAQGTGVA